MNKKTWMFVILSGVLAISLMIADKGMSKGQAKKKKSSREYYIQNILKKSAKKFNSYKSPVRMLASQKGSKFEEQNSKYDKIFRALKLYQFPRVEVRGTSFVIKSKKKDIVIKKVVDPAKWIFSFEGKKFKVDPRWPIPKKYRAIQRAFTKTKKSNSSFFNIIFPAVYADEINFKTLEYGKPKQKMNMLNLILEQGSDEQKIKMMDIVVDSGSWRAFERMIGAISRSENDSAKARLGVIVNSVLSTIEFSVYTDLIGRMRRYELKTNLAKEIFTVGYRNGVLIGGSTCELTGADQYVVETIRSIGLDDYESDYISRKGKIIVTTQEVDTGFLDLGHTGVFMVEWREKKKGAKYYKAPPGGEITQQVHFESSAKNYLFHMAYKPEGSNPEALMNSILSDYKAANSTGGLVSDDYSMAWIPAKVIECCEDKNCAEDMRRMQSVGVDLLQQGEVIPKDQRDSLSQ